MILTLCLAQYTCHPDSLVASSIEGLRSKTGFKRFLVSGDIRTLKNNCTVNLKYDVYTRLYEDTCVISAFSR